MQEELGCSQQGDVSAMNLLLIKYLGEIKNLDMATRVKMWPGIIGGSYRKRWSSSEGALYQCTHLGKGASKGLEIKDEVGDRADYCMDKILYALHC